MLDIHGLLAQLKRPRLLVSAARFGVDDYSRDRDLRRLLRTDSIPRPGAALLRLIDIEAAMNEQRVQNDAIYSIAQHVDALTAIMGEAHLLQAITRPREADPT